VAQTIIRALKFSDEIVSCYKDPAELVLFHDVEMKGHIREENVSFREFCESFGTFVGIKPSTGLSLWRS
jgi:hypothetical protein